MEYFKTFVEALAASAQTNVVWADRDGTLFGLEEMANFARTADQENPLDPNDAWAVSIEGAIGVANKYEFMIDWIFYPIFDQQIIDQYAARLRQKAKESRPAKQYCAQCGKQINTGSRFCKYCGAEIR